VDVYYDISPDECRNLTENTEFIFTYYGANSEPYQRVCMLHSSCETTSNCQDCFTETSASNCECSLPYQCYVNGDNVIEILKNRISSEKLCQQICYDSSASNCTVYNYYDMNHVESPGLCVLLKSCDQVVSTTCEGCHLGPRACAKQGGQCGFAMWSTSMSGVVMETSNSRLRLMSGEPGCSREVRMLVVGGGGGGILSRAGGGSGYIEFNDSALVVANTDLDIIVGEGGSMNIKGSDTTISYSLESTGEELLRALGGQEANTTDGGDGYSGGGAQWMPGGSDGEDGSGYSDQFLGGTGSGIKVADFQFDNFILTAGSGGIGADMDIYGGGGGGGVLVNGNGPDRHEYQGEGFGGGGAGYNETSGGLQGCVIMEIVEMN